MHSSRMRTARAQTISPWSQGGVCGPGGVPGLGVYLVPGGVPGHGGVSGPGGVGGVPGQVPPLLTE